MKSRLKNQLLLGAASIALASTAQAQNNFYGIAPIGGADGVCAPTTQTFPSAPLTFHAVDPYFEGNTDRTVFAQYLFGCVTTDGDDEAAGLIDGPFTPSGSVDRTDGFGRVLPGFGHVLDAFLTTTGDEAYGLEILDHKELKLFSETFGRRQGGAITTSGWRAHGISAQRSSGILHYLDPITTSGEAANGINLLTGSRGWWINAEDISVSGDGSVGVFFNEPNGVHARFRDISATGDFGFSAFGFSSAHAIRIQASFATQQTARIETAGVISSRTGDAISSSQGLDLINNGVLRGGFAAVSGGFLANNQITNFGQIDGAIVTGFGDDTLINGIDGVINGDIVLWSGRNRVDNLGIINGDVYLRPRIEGSAGPSVFESFGDVNGDVYFGDNSDEFVLKGDGALGRVFGGGGGQDTFTVTNRQADLNIGDVSGFEWLRVNAHDSGRVSFTAMGGFAGSIDIIKGEVRLTGGTYGAPLGAPLSPTHTLAEAVLSVGSDATLRGAVVGDGSAQQVEIYGWLDSDYFYLGAGDDRVTVGSGARLTATNQQPLLLRGGVGRDTLVLAYGATPLNITWGGRVNTDLDTNQVLQLSPFDMVGFEGLETDAISTHFEAGILRDFSGLFTADNATARFNTSLWGNITLSGADLVFEAGRGAGADILVGDDNVTVSGRLNANSLTVLAPDATDLRPSFRVASGATARLGDVILDTTDLRVSGELFFDTFEARERWAWRGVIDQGGLWKGGVSRILLADGNRNFSYLDIFGDADIDEIVWSTDAYLEGTLSSRDTTITQFGSLTSLGAQINIDQLATYGEVSLKASLALIGDWLVSGSEATIDVSDDAAPFDPSQPVSMRIGALTLENASVSLVGDAFFADTINLVGSRFVFTPGAWLGPGPVTLERVREGGKTFGDQFSSGALTLTDSTAHFLGHADIPSVTMNGGRFRAERGVDIDRLDLVNGGNFRAMAAPGETSQLGVVSITESELHLEGTGFEADSLTGAQQATLTLDSTLTTQSFDFTGESLLIQGAQLGGLVVSGEADLSAERITLSGASLSFAGAIDNWDVSGVRLRGAQSRIEFDQKLSGPYLGLQIVDDWSNQATLINGAALSGFSLFVSRGRFESMAPVTVTDKLSVFVGVDGEVDLGAGLETPDGFRDAQIYVAGKLSGPISLANSIDTSVYLECRNPVDIDLTGSINAQVELISACPGSINLADSISPHLSVRGRLEGFWNLSGSEDALVTFGLPRGRGGNDGLLDLTDTITPTVQIGDWLADAPGGIIDLQGAERPLVNISNYQIVVRNDLLDIRTHGSFAPDIRLTDGVRLSIDNTSNVDISSSVHFESIYIGTGLRKTVTRTLSGGADGGLLSVDSIRSGPGSLTIKDLAPGETHIASSADTLIDLTHSAMTEVDETYRIDGSFNGNLTVTNAPLPQVGGSTRLTGEINFVSESQIFTIEGQLLVDMDVNFGAGNDTLRVLPGWTTDDLENWPVFFTDDQNLIYRSALRGGGLNEDAMQGNLAPIRRLGGRYDMGPGNDRVVIDTPFWPVLNEDPDPALSDREKFVLLTGRLGIETINTGPGADVVDFVLRHPIASPDRDDGLYQRLLDTIDGFDPALNTTLFSQSDFWPNPNLSGFLPADLNMGSGNDTLRFYFGYGNGPDLMNDRFVTDYPIAWGGSELYYDSFFNSYRPSTSNIRLGSGNDRVIFDAGRDDVALRDGFTQRFSVATRNVKYFPGSGYDRLVLTGNEDSVGVFDATAGNNNQLSLFESVDVIGGTWTIFGNDNRPCRINALNGATVSLEVSTRVDQRSGASDPEGIGESEHCKEEETPTLLYVDAFSYGWVFWTGRLPRLLIDRHINDPINMYINGTVAFGNSVKSGLEFFDDSSDEIDDFLEDTADDVKDGLEELGDLFGLDAGRVPLDSSQVYGLMLDPSTPPRTSDSRDGRPVRPRASARAGAVSDFTSPSEFERSPLDDPHGAQSAAAGSATAGESGTASTETQSDEEPEPPTTGGIIAANNLVLDGGTVRLSIYEDGTTDQLLVRGDMVNAGGTLLLASAGGEVPDQINNVKLITVEGEMIGGFSSIFTPDNISPTFFLDADGAIAVSMRRNDVSLANFALTGNAAAVGRALDRLDPADFQSDSAERAFVEELRLVTGPELEASLATLTGEVHMASPLLMDVMLAGHQNAVSGRIGANVELTDDRPYFWSSAIDANARIIDGDDVAARLNGLGGVWGVDRAVSPSLRLGAAVSFSEANTSSGPFREGGDASLLTLSAYASGQAGALEWALSGTVGEAERALQRTTVRRSAVTTLESRERAETYSVRADFAHPYRVLDGVSFGPALGLEWRAVQTDGAREDVSSGVGLYFEPTTYERMGVEVGADIAIERPLGVGGSTSFFLEASPRFRVEVGDTDTDRVGRFALAPQDTAFVLDGPSIESKAFVGGLAAGFEGPTWRAALEGSSVWSEREEVYAFRLSLAKRF